MAEHNAAKRSASDSTLTPSHAEQGPVSDGNGSSARKKQKRNKPTLSCEECVVRKTKCDRGRPQCKACAKRASVCRYSQIADLMVAANDGAPPRPKKQRTSVLGDRETHPTTIQGAIPTLQTKALTPRAAIAIDHTNTIIRSGSLSSASSPFLLSNIPYSNHTPSPFFGHAAEHPFANYWTSRGGLPEVIGVVPAKDQTDILVAKYFESVDPVYPMIHRRNFYADYERFWSSTDEEKNAADPVLIALHFVVYAMGTQFTTSAPDTSDQRRQIAEFYVSASQQALRLSGYLSRASVRTLQAMVLICYFLMNDNHASDAWAFGGVLARQAYAMGLHRDPDHFTPRCSQSDKHQRRKLWQAIYFQDTFLTVLLKLPPTTSFSDVRVESLTDELDDYVMKGTPEAIPNPMSISNIVPMSDAFPPYELADRQYIRSMWRMADLVQRTVCRPRALDRPLTTSVESKATLIKEYHDLHASFPLLLATSDDEEVLNLYHTNTRSLRQNLFFRSNFWHCVMILHADENKASGVSCDVQGALNAARMALMAFFHFWEYLRVDAGVWWVFQHRAFEEALCVARILSSEKASASFEPISSPMVDPALDPLFLSARDDAIKTLQILEHINHVPEMQKTRTEVLKSALADIKW